MPLHLHERRRATARRARALAGQARDRCTAVVLIALLGALCGGLVGIGAGQWLGWRTAGPLPTDDQASAIARLALGGPAPAPQRFSDLFGYDRSGAYGPGRVRFVVPDEPAVWRARDVRVRLDTAGWRVDPAGTTGLLFVADKGRWRVRYSTAGADHVNLDIVRTQPIWVLPAGAVGGLLGAAFGWLVARRAVRGGQALAARSARPRLAAGFAVAGGVAAAPVLVVLLAQQIGGYRWLARPGIPLWTAVTSPVPGGLAVLAGVLLAAAVLAAGRQRVDA